MILRQYLVQRHWSASIDSRKCLCPFHGDRNPSAYINDNSIWCFVCQKMYSLYDFQKTFNVSLDKVPEKSSTLSTLHGKVEDNKPYFVYNWKKS